MLRTLLDGDVLGMRHQGFKNQRNIDRKAVVFQSNRWSFWKGVRFYVSFQDPLNLLLTAKTTGEKPVRLDWVEEGVDIPEPGNIL